MFFEIPILAVLALHTKRKRYGLVELTPFYSKGQVVCAYQVLGM